MSTFTDSHAEYLRANFGDQEVHGFVWRPRHVDFQRMMAIADELEAKVMTTPTRAQRIEEAARNLAAEWTRKATSFPGTFMADGYLRAASELLAALAAPPEQESTISWGDITKQSPSPDDIRKVAEHFAKVERLKAVRTAATTLRKSLKYDVINCLPIYWVSTCTVADFDRDVAAALTEART